METDKRLETLCEEFTDLKEENERNGIYLYFMGSSIPERKPLPGRGVNLSFNGSNGTFSRGDGLIKGAGIVVPNLRRCWGIRHGICAAFLVCNYFLR